MALCFERFVAYLASPGRGADRLPDPGAIPRVPLARVAPIAVEEGCLKVRVAAEVLDCQPRPSPRSLGPQACWHEAGELNDQGCSEAYWTVSQGECRHLAGTANESTSEDDKINGQRADAAAVKVPGADIYVGCWSP